MTTKNPLIREPSASVAVTPNLYVAIGASAGGLEAIETFFSGMAAESGLAFIVVQHLSPDYKSLMVEILSKKTAMNVHRAEDGMHVDPNNVYLIPPKKNLTIFHGKLFLSEQPHVKGTINLPIDVFLRSLAEDQEEKAVAVILSGSGSDGMRGVRTIKEFGGMVMVQREDTARFDSMPRAAISTGLADFILPPEEMPVRLVAYAKHPSVAKLDRGDGDISDEDALPRIFAILRNRFKVDFTYYKPSTVHRRIERRMSVNRLDEIRDYVSTIQDYPGEAAILFRELLIGVTRFFRDREVFDTLADKWMRRVLVRGGPPEIRLWVAGCSTGEEAYTLAILVREAMYRFNISRDVKIFATDIDRDAIVSAANGMFPESIAADVPSELLSKYFFRQRDSFQIARNIREMVVFAQHNLIKDPPFTRIDLVSCRNLLIYLQPVLQRKVLEFFNFSLEPGGILLLGTSETIGEMGDYFETLDQKSKIFQTKGRIKSLVGATPLEAVPRQYDQGRRVFPLARPGMDERLLERTLEVLKDELPLIVVVNEQMDVLHVIGETEGFFKLPSGKLTTDISRMAVKELAIPLSTGIQKVFRKNESLRFSNIRLRRDDGFKVVHLRIKPLSRKKDQELLAVIVLETAKTVEAENLSKGQNYDLSQEVEQRISDLEQELQFTRENLQATVEELETSNEELQATNEELLASNEELQSTNEELQSTNEELYSVNSEYQSKILELSELHNDVDNLLNASHIGQLLLDENLEIRRFSQEVMEVFTLLETDLGRPLGHITHTLVGVDPIEEIKAVQRTGAVHEREVQTHRGKWMLMRVTPYVVGPDVFSGVLVSFVDISRIMRMEEKLRASEEKHRLLFETMAQGVISLAADGRVLSVNPAAERILGLTFDQIKDKTCMDVHGRMFLEDETTVPGSEHPAMIALRTGKPFGPVIRGVHHPARNTPIWLKITGIPLFHSGERSAFQAYATFEDVTEQQAALKESGNC